MPQIALDDIERDIEQVLRQELASIGLNHVELKAGVDHDGDAAVFITAVLPSEAPLVPGDVGAAARVAVAKVLDRAGDDRVSYLYLRRADDADRPIDDIGARSP